MQSVPHNTVSCFTLDFSGNRQSEVIKFDKDFKFLNVTVRKDGWIKWDYDSTNLENYNFKFKLALAGLHGGGSVNLNFWLEEVIPTTPIPANGYPVEYVTEFKEDTYSSVRHTANRSTVLGGLVYQVEMKLDQQHVHMPRINEQRTRWFRLRIATRAPLSCAASDSQLNGFRVPIENSQNGLLPGNEYATFYFPFISLYLEKAATSLLDTDMTSMQIVTFNDLSEFKHDLIEEINEENSDINTAITEFVSSLPTDNIVEDVRVALIEDLSDSSTAFSTAVLELLSSTMDFVVEPDNASVSVGNNVSFDIVLFNGLDINSIQAVSNDTSKVTVTIDKANKKIIATAVAEGVTTITVKSTAIPKIETLDITVNPVPSEATFKATNVSNDLIAYKMWASLDTTTSELTLASPNGSDIILAGWVIDVDTVAKTALVRYLKVNPSNYAVSYDAPTYTPAEGDVFNLKNGIAVALGTGYEVPNCTLHVADSIRKTASVWVKVTASDINTLEQHKLK